VTLDCEFWLGDGVRVDTSDDGIAEAEDAGVFVEDGAGAGVADWQATGIVAAPKQAAIATNVLMCPPE
jgi:hypothetical protein